VHEALLAELCLSEICQGPIRDGGRRTDNSEVTVVKIAGLLALNLNYTQNPGYRVNERNCLVSPLDIVVELL
jgi:hypothetical protein